MTDKTKKTETDDKNLNPVLTPDNQPIPGGAGPADADEGREEAKKYVRPEDR